MEIYITDEDRVLKHHGLWKCEKSVTESLRLVYKADIYIKGGINLVWAETASALKTLSYIIRRTMHPIKTDKTGTMICLPIPWVG